MDLPFETSSISILRDLSSTSFCWIWVVERTLSWLNRADVHLAFLQLGCALISLRFLDRRARPLLY